MKEEQLQIKTSELMYALVKNAARDNFEEFLEEWDLTLDDYREIRDHMMDKLKINRPYI